MSASSRRSISLQRRSIVLPVFSLRVIGAPLEVLPSPPTLPVQRAPCRENPVCLRRERGVSLGPSLDPASADLPGPIAAVDVEGLLRHVIGVGGGEEDGGAGDVLRLLDAAERNR